MFRKLKIQLTLINLILTSLVLIAIFSAIYTLNKQGIERSNNALMERVAISEKIAPEGRPDHQEGHPDRQDHPPSPLELRPPEERPGFSNCFYLKADQSGKVLAVSPNSTLTDEEVKELFAITLANNKNKGSVTYQNYTLNYIITLKSYGSIIVYIDESQNKEVLNRLLTTSISVGAISLLLVFIISLALASKAIVPVKNSWEKQKAFVADASHELRTPLAVMRTNLDVVLGSPDETIESQYKWLGYIESEIHRMTKLVEDLLFLARSDDAKEGVPMSNFSLSDALEKSIVPFEAVALEREIEFTIDITPDIVFHGNEGRIKQLVAILIDNALKYTPSRGKVGLKMLKDEDRIDILVSDSGEGIPHEHLEKVFERFYKVDKARSGSEGFGLGLSIAKAIVNEHKGKLSVSSVVGKCTTFKASF